MPDWTHNKLTVEGDHKSLSAFKKRLAGQHGALDFNQLDPMPEHSETFYADGNIGAEEEAQYGKNNWYDWSTEHWGTKWNACDIEVSEFTNGVVYTFDTASDAPRPLVSKVVDLAHALSLEVAWGVEHEFGGSEVLVEE